jgi:large subunit ribosomal protein L10
MPGKAVLQKKKEMVEQLVEKIKASKAVVLADYRGLTVEEDTNLRSELRKSGIEYRVVKNSIMRFAIKDTGFDELSKYLEGPTSVAFSKDDPVEPARILNMYSKKHENLELKAGIIEGLISDVSKLKVLAGLPSKEELIAKAIAGFGAPMYGIVNVLNANISGLAVALNQILEKKQNQSVQ